MGFGERGGLGSWFRVLGVGLDFWPHGHFMVVSRKSLSDPLV